jgi:hypothetical protein
MIALPKIQIIFAAVETPRFSEFHGDLWRLYAGLPAGTPRPQWRVGVDLCYSLNSAIRDTPKDVEAFWFIGDDHTFEPTVIERLWQHNVPVVAPYCLKRSAPHQPVTMSEQGTVMVPGPQQTGLWQVPMVGSAGLLVRRAVMDQIGDPWFSVPNRPGQERQSEDLEFCRKIGRLGYPIYVDLDTCIGHITRVEVWPARHPTAGWVVSYRVSLRQQILP